MKRKNPNTAGAKRRRTLTLGAETLLEAKRIATARGRTLNTVIAEALSEGLRYLAATERSQQVLKSYKRAFSSFSDQETLMLDGVMLEPNTER